MILDDLFEHDLLQSRRNRTAASGLASLDCEPGSFQEMLQDLPPIVWVPAWASYKVSSYFLPGRENCPSLMEWSNAASIGTLVFNVFSAILWINVGVLAIKTLLFILL